MGKYNMDIEGMPYFDKSMERIEAWFEHEIVDRAPIRFHITRPEKNQTGGSGAPAAKPPKLYGSLRERWFDYECIIDRFHENLSGRQFIAESFPVYYPNLGPGVYAAFYGAELVFEESTSWTVPLIREPSEAKALRIDWNNIYLKTLDAMTDYALERLRGKAIVGYTDLHPSMDCVADWIDSQELCLKLRDDPEGVLVAVDRASEDFESVYNHFDGKLKSHGQLSVSWMQIPTPGRMHIPSCDFSFMISGDDFRKFCLPGAMREMQTTTHNIWHLDGAGCARHLDDLLAVKEIQVIQWVQGAGEGEPIMQWIPLLKKILSAGKSVIINLRQSEFMDVIGALPPKGVFLSVGADTEADAFAMLRMAEKWTK